MIFKIKRYFKYIIRRLLFKDDCIICNKTLVIKERAFCKKCLENLKSISSLKKYKNIYYLWILDEELLNMLRDFKNRLILVEDLREIISEKLFFILENEQISNLSYKNSEFWNDFFTKKVLRSFFRYMNLENKKKLIFKEYINKIDQNIKEENIYFTLLTNTKL